MTKRGQGRERGPASRDELEARARRELADWEARGESCEDGFTTSHRSVLPGTPPDRRGTPLPPLTKGLLH